MFQRGKATESDKGRSKGRFLKKRALKLQSYDLEEEQD